MLDVQCNNCRNPRQISLYRLLVCVVWLTGVLIGCYLSCQVPYESLLMMRMLDVEHVSIVGILLVQLFPLFISALLLRFFSYYWILPVVWIEAILYGCCGDILSLAFGDAAWLACGLILFSSILSAPIYLWYWLHVPACRKGSGGRVLYSAAAVLALVGMIDYFAVSPFWEALL